MKPLNSGMLTAADKARYKRCSAKSISTEANMKDRIKHWPGSRLFAVVTAIAQLFTMIMNPKQFRKIKTHCIRAGHGSSHPFESSKRFHRLRRTLASQTTTSSLESMSRSCSSSERVERPKTMQNVSYKCNIDFIIFAFFRSNFSFFRNYS